MMHQRMVKLILILCASPWVVMPAAHSAELPWVLVDTAAHTVSVIKAGEVKATFAHAALGRGGVASVHYKGDGRTPLGTFRVAWVNRNSRFHVFFGLDYPNDNQAEIALQRNKIDIDTYYDIRKAAYQGALPPQDTNLGGYIGIHGLGHGNLALHRLANWTQGCIALTNDQIDRLAQWVDIGTRVVIR
jgi:murein L,D-transpeptidase YafK